MKNLILILMLSLLLTGCMSTTIPGLGFVQTDAGVRVYKSEEAILVHVTHKKGEPAPAYKDIAILLKSIFK